MDNKYNCFSRIHKVHANSTVSFLDALDIIERLLMISYLCTSGFYDLKELTDVVWFNGSSASIYHSCLVFSNWNKNKCKDYMRSCSFIVHRCMLNLSDQFMSCHPTDQCQCVLCTMYDQMGRTLGYIHVCSSWTLKYM